MVEEYKEQIRDKVLDEDNFVRLTMKGKLRHASLPWRQVIVRPVQIKKERYLQFSYFTEKQDVTKNYQNSEAREKLDEILALPFSTISVQSIPEDLVVQITKKGKAILHRNERSATTRKPDLSHDVSKQLPLPANKPDAFLQTIGIMDEHGKIRPNMHGKFSQVNEFLKLLEHTGELERFEKTPVNILDCGCGSAYLSFAAYHYLNDIRRIPARLVGVDVNEVLIRKDNAQSEALGFSDACFQKSTIIDYKAEMPPDIVLALHACDTATDEAIAQGVLWQARLILCAPCCQHDLNQQLREVEIADSFHAVFRHGILKERMADILTDTFRALILSILGYKTDVIEFVASEHTNKNLMIRAVKRENLNITPFVQEYLALKKFWGVTPYLEKLLGNRFTSLLE